MCLENSCNNIATYLTVIATVDKLEFYGYAYDDKGTLRFLWFSSFSASVVITIIMVMKDLITVLCIRTG